MTVLLVWHVVGLCTDDNILFCCILTDRNLKPSFRRPFEYGSYFTWVLSQSFIARRPAFQNLTFLTVIWTNFKTGRVCCIIFLAKLIIFSIMACSEMCYKVQFKVVSSCRVLVLSLPMLVSEVHNLFSVWLYFWKLDWFFFFTYHGSCMC